VVGQPEVRVVEQVQHVPAELEPASLTEIVEAAREVEIELDQVSIGLGMRSEAQGMTKSPTFLCDLRTQFGQGAAQFVCCTEEGLSGVAFAGLENDGHGAQSQSLTVLHHKDGTLAGGEFVECAGDAHAHFARRQVGFRVVSASVVGHAVQDFGVLAIGGYRKG